MTCIVGIADGKTVTIGGDSAGSDGWHVAVRSDPKVFTVGPYLLGFTGSFRMGQLLRYSLDIGAPGTWDVDRWMATTFIDAVRECLKKGGFAKEASGQEEGDDFLVGIRGRLYTIHSDYQVAQTGLGFTAVGSGYLVALGSLHSTAAGTSDPRGRVLMALKAATDLTGDVRPPYAVLEAS